MSYRLLGPQVFEFAKNLPNLFKARYFTCVEFAELLPTAGLCDCLLPYPAFAQPREINPSAALDLSRPSCESSFFRQNKTS